MGCMQHHIRLIRYARHELVVSQAQCLQSATITGAPCPNVLFWTVQIEQPVKLIKVSSGFPMK